MRTYSISEELFGLFFTDSTEDFQERLASWLENSGAGPFTLWSVTGSVCQPSPVRNGEAKGAFDIYELGFPGGGKPVNRTVSYFDESFYISWAFFFGTKNRILCAVTFHSDGAYAAAKELDRYSDYISKRVSELFSADRSMDLYVDYQKKVDFVKKAGVIFKALEVESVVSVSLSFFSEVFSADAVCALADGKFSGIGLEESDLDKNIFIAGVSLREYMEKLDRTEFTENMGRSSKFNIKNIFFVYEETCRIRFALFNVMSDVVPDREFSSLVSGIVSIAVENARNHEQMTRFKIEETEMNSTVEILNKFVMRKIRPEIEGCDIFAMNCPAKKAGGDFIDIRKKDGKIKFCIADVCGKGYSAAIFTVVLSAFFSGRDFYDLRDFITDLNGFLLTKNFGDKFITGFFAILDTESRTLDYIYCGHEPVALITENGAELLESKNLPLGLMEEDYEVKRAAIPEGSTLFAYTDGLLEYTDFEGLMDIMKENEKSTAERTAENLYETLVKDPETQKDDFTCVIMKL